MSNISYDFRKATMEEASELFLSDTKMTAINTCPRWGIIRYHHKKTMAAVDQTRVLPLEMGGLCHSIFAMQRLWQLKYQQNLPEHADTWGLNMFGARYEDAETVASQYTPGSHDHMVEQCLALLDTSGYMDDPDDRFRTKANIEMAMRHYLENWSTKNSVAVEDSNDPSSRVGIEVDFFMVVTRKIDEIPEKSYYIKGKIDGVYQRLSDGLLVVDNKTTRTNSEGSRAGFSMSHQLTTYALAAQLTFNRPAEKVAISRIQIPLSKTNPDASMSFDIANVYPERVVQWLKWVEHTQGVLDQYKDVPLDAPTYTHSCNRFFRPCSFLPMCDAPTRQEKELILQEMAMDNWSLEMGEG